MAASLQKLRQLEQQVRLIPLLQVKVSVLQEEKRQMAQQLQELKSKSSSSMNIFYNLITFCLYNTLFDQVHQKRMLECVHFPVSLKMR